MKHVNEFKQRNVSVSARFKITANVFKYTADLSLDCRLFYPTEMVLTQHDSTLLNWCLKTLKTVKEFKQRNVSIFSWVHVYENATNVFKKVRIYPCKFTSSIKTTFQLCESNIKHDQ